MSLGVGFAGRSMNNPPLDKKSLTAEQQAMLEKYEADQKSLILLGDIADITQELLNVVDSRNSEGAQSSQAIGALLLDIRESLSSLDSKEAPEAPDSIKPVVEAVTKLEKVLGASIKAIDVKPIVNTPQVNVKSPNIDLSGVEKAVKEIPKAFEKAIKLIPKTEIPEADYGPLLEKWDSIAEQLVSIETATRMKPQMGSIKVSNLSEVNLGPSSAQTTSVGDSTTSGVLIDANPNRKEVEFYNTSTAILYLLKGGGVASSTHCTVAIQSTGWYRTSYRGQITGVWASDAGGTVQITEST